MAINLNILAAVKGLNNLRKVEQSLKTIRTVGVSGFQKLLAFTRKHNGALSKNNEFLSRSADRIGFMAFQFTFLEGIAQRVLGGIQRTLQDIIGTGAEGIDKMIRAVAQSGIDFSGSTKDSADAVQFLNDALMTLGGGATMFSMNEVADAMKEIGKATDLTGTEMQKANKLVGVTQQVLRMMKIEEVQSDEAAKTLIKTMNNFNLTLDEAKRVTDVMINVNQSSAITLDELSRSFGFASSQAKDFGMDVETTGALIGVLGNRLGQGAGAAGRNFRQLLVGLKNQAIQFNPILEEMGMAILDNNGNIKPFVEWLDQIRTSLNDAGKSSDAFKLFLQDQLGLEVRAADALAKLTQASKDQVDAAIEAARAGDSTGLEAVLDASPETSLKRIESSVNSLKLQFVSGLAPALNKIADLIFGITSDKELQQMMSDIGDILGTKVIPMIKEFADALKVILKLFTENKGALEFLIKGFIIFIQLMIAMLIVASVGKIIAAFTSLILKLTLALGTGQAAGATGALTNTGKAAKSLRVQFLTIIAVIAGIIIAVFAFRDLLKLLTDDVDNSAQGMDILIASLLTLGGVALAGIVGGVPGLIAVGAALAAIAAITWLEQIGAIEAFWEAFNAGMENIDDAESDWEAFGITVQSVVDGLGALGWEAGFEIGKNIRLGWMDFVNSWDWSYWDTMIGEFMSGNWIRGLALGTSLVSAMWKGFVTTILAMFLPADQIKNMIDSQSAQIDKDAMNLGMQIGEGIRQGLVDFFTGKNIVTGLLEGLLGPAFQIANYTPKVRPGSSEALSEDPFSADPIARETGTTQGGSINNNDTTIWDAWKQNMEEFTPAIASSAESLKATNENLEIIQEPLVEMAEETMVNANESFKLSTEGMKEMKKNADDASAKVVAFTKTTKLGDIGQQVNTIRVKALTTQEQALGETMDIWQFEIARLVNITIDTQGSMVSAQSALTKLAIEGAEAARRLSTLKVSKDGKFSMSGRSTSTTFGERGLASAIPRILATELGDKINLAELARAQEQRQQTVNNTINITIEGAADDETAQRTAEAVQEVLSKEIEDKSILTSTGTV